MFYQNCQNCNGEWKGKKLLKTCPFCDMEMQMKTNNFDKIEEALGYVLSQYGMELISSPSKLVSLLADFAPSLERERRLIRIALNSGVYSELIKVNKDDKDEQELAKKKAISSLNQKEFMDIVWAEKVINWFIPQLHWTFCTQIIKNIDKIIKKYVEVE